MVKQASIPKRAAIVIYAEREDNRFSSLGDMDRHECVMDSRSDDGIPRDTRTVSLYSAMIARIGCVLCFDANFLSIPSGSGLKVMHNCVCLGLWSLVKFWRSSSASSREFVVVVNVSHRIVQRMKILDFAV